MAEQSRLSLDELNDLFADIPGDDYEVDSFENGLPLIETVEPTLARPQAAATFAFDGALLENPALDALVVPVNLRGAMGAGFALEVKRRYPEIEMPYQRALLAGDLAAGKPWVYDRSAATGGPRFLACIATKDDWRDASRIEDLAAGISALPDALHAQNDPHQPSAQRVKTVGIPGLGTGLGGLDEADVFPLVERAFANSGFTIVHAFASQVQQHDFAAELEARAQERLFTEPAVRPAAPARGFYKNGWLSNFNEFETPLVENDISYPTPEHYFQAAKCVDERDKRRLTTMTPAEAKKAAKHMDQMPEDLWGAQSEAVMRTALEHRFAPGTNACSQLLATGTRELVEWNNWGDRTWGRDIATGDGENRLGSLLMELRAERREQGLEPRTDMGDPDRDRPVQSPAATRCYAAVGSRSLPRSHPLARFAEQTAMRLERLGFTVRSGGASGADAAFESGVHKAEHKEIFRPEYDRTKRLPPGYVIVDGAPAREARSIVAAVTTNFSTMSSFGQDLHTRNAFQVLGGDLKSPVEFVLAIPKPFDGRVTGTWSTMAIAKAHDVPVFDISQPADRNRFIATLKEMEIAAGRPWDGPELAAAHAPVRGHLPVGPARLPSTKPIAVNVVNVREINLGSETAVYVGRTESIPVQFEIEAAHDLGNPFVVGRDGMTGSCAVKFWDRFADQLSGDTRLQDRIAELVERAIDKGAIDIACHGCSPCHADAIAVAVMDGVSERGFGVTTNIPERAKLVQPATQAELAAAAELKARGLDHVPKNSPWRKVEGEVLLANEREAIIHLGDGMTRSIDQRRLEDPLSKGAYATLIQGDRGLERLAADKTLTLNR